MMINRSLKICQTCPKLIVSNGINKLVYNCPIADGGWRTVKMHEDWYIPDNCERKFEYLIMSQKNIDGELIN